MVELVKFHKSSHHNLYKGNNTLTVLVGQNIETIERFEFEMGVLLLRDKGKESRKPFVVR